MVEFKVKIAELLTAPKEEIKSRVIFLPKVSPKNAIKKFPGMHVKYATAAIHDT